MMMNLMICQQLGWSVWVATELWESYEYLEDNPQVIVCSLGMLGLWYTWTTKCSDFQTMQQEMIQIPKSWKMFHLNTWYQMFIYIDSQTEYEVEAEDTGNNDIVIISS